MEIGEVLCLIGEMLNKCILKNMKKIFFINVKVISYVYFVMCLKIQENNYILYVYQVYLGIRFVMC